jgi:hypothetical protein
MIPESPSTHLPEGTAVLAVLDNGRREGGSRKGGGKKELRSHGKCQTKQ